MDHSVFLQYAQTLGFPICTSVALAWALYKVGTMIFLYLNTLVTRGTEAHFDLINTTKQHGENILKELNVLSEEAKIQSELLSKWTSDPKKVMGCKMDNSSGVDALAKAVAAHLPKK